MFSGSIISSVYKQTPPPLLSARGRRCSGLLEHHAGQVPDRIGVNTANADSFLYRSTTSTAEALRPGDRVTDRILDDLLERLVVEIIVGLRRIEIRIRVRAIQQHGGDAIRKRIL